MKPFAELSMVKRLLEHTVCAIIPVLQSSHTRISYQGGHCLHKRDNGLTRSERSQRHRRDEILRLI